MKLPFLEQALVPDSKLANYLLDPLHPKGRSKAVFFLRLGFARERPDELRQALLEVAARTEMEEIAYSGDRVFIRAQVHRRRVDSNATRHGGRCSYGLGVAGWSAAAALRDGVSRA